MDSESLNDKTILITGGTGSFGRTLTRALIESSNCKKIIIFSRDEWKQWEMRESHPSFADARLRYFLGDVRDAKRLSRAFKEVDIVVHAAALKQVPAAEYNPSEFVNTNILGAMNIIDAAIDAGVEKVLALSTDKAVNPVNLYGATKLCADKLFVAGNAYVGSKHRPRMSVVRYGNVLGSRGSIIPYWQGLVAKGAKKLPVTDPRMTRFWITLEQTIAFVVQCLQHMRGGEIFVPKIPSMKITDLAHAIAPHLPLEICGIRPGEKIHELLISAEDGRNVLEFNGHFVIQSQYASAQADWQRYPQGCGKPVQEGFAYASELNTDWLSIADLQKWVEIPEVQIEAKEVGLELERAGSPSAAG